MGSTWIVRIIDLAFTVYVYMIIARCLASWFPIPSLRNVYQFLYEMTEPVLYFFRNLIGNRFPIPIDLSPWVAIIVLQFVQSFVRNILIRILIF